MNNIMIGDVVRHIRENKGITQAKLCDGICSISTLSRIENGRQHPTRGLITLLAERMGEEGIIYDDYLGDFDYEMYSLATRIMEYLERGDNMRANSCLDELRYIVEDKKASDNKGYYIYFFLELLSSSVEHHNDLSSDIDSRSDILERRQYGYHMYEQINSLIDKCIGLDIKRGGGNLDKIEIRMYNFLGYAACLKENYKEAVDIWVKLLNEYRDKDYSCLLHIKEKASIYSNISAALSLMDMCDEAVLFASKGLKLCQHGGGLKLVYRLLHNRICAHCIKGDDNKAYKDLALAKSINTLIKPEFSEAKLSKNLPRKPYLIQIF